MKRKFYFQALVVMIIMLWSGFGWAGDLYVGGGGTPNYTTIQAAVTAASDGDVIHIAAGTYNQALTIPKSLTFIGAGPSSNPTTIITSTANPMINLSVTGKSFSFQNLIIHGNVSNNGIRAGSSININSLTLKDVIGRNCQVALYLGEYYSGGVFMTTTVNNLLLDNVTLTNNKFIGAYIGKTVLTGMVTNCTVTDNGYSSDLPNTWQKTGLQFVNFDEASVPHVVVTNSYFSNNGTGASNIERTGLIIYTAYNGLSANEIMTVSGCTFTNHPLYAVRIKNGYNKGNTATVNGTFTGNYLDIWFNNVIGYTSSSTLVRRTFTGIRTVGAGPTYDYNTIQAAINAASDGDVIAVAAGTYVENVTVNKTVSLLGANENIACDSRVTESVIAPVSGAGFNVIASGVTINGFEVTAPTSTNAIIIGGTTSNTNIKFNNVHHIGTTLLSGNVHAILLQVGNSVAISDVNISDNCIQNISSPLRSEFSASAIGILHSQSTGTLTTLNIERNIINEVNVNTGVWPSGKIAYGIVINTGSNPNYAGSVINANINDNEISNLHGHISHAIGLEGPTPNAIVSNNKIENLTTTKTPPDAVGVMVEANTASNSISINYNSFTNLAYGIVNISSITPFDGTCNWYASVLGKTYGAVTCVPWLTSGVDGNPVAPGFQPAVPCVACEELSCSIAALPGSGPYTGGDPNRIYLGYGPQSVTLSSTVSGGSATAYSWSGTAGLSCTTCASPVFTPTSEGMYEFTLMVTFNNGCTSTCSITICVLDIRVPGNNGKVYLCHVPPGNPNNPQTLSVNINAVPAHVPGHPLDHLGTCSQSCGNGPQGGVESGELILSEDHSISTIVYPNPFTDDFTVTVETESQELVNISVYDLIGRKLQEIKSILPNTSVTVTNDLDNGTYVLFVQQGDQAQKVKIIKYN